MDTAHNFTRRCNNIRRLFLDWKSVRQNTIAKCFSKARLAHESLADDDEDNDSPLFEWI